MDVHGIVFCRILPPRNLLFPVLPLTINSKLMFVLCFTCATNESSEKCMHTPAQRCLEGVWVSYEIHAALKYGYTMLEVYETWHYEETRKMGPGEEGLWGGFVNEMLKQKQQACGWPRPDMTEEEKQQYLADYLQYENISLEYDKIIKNDVIKNLNKGLLNSLWGV